jgi:drug/metabolite transporter (DMT)-like permease
LPAFFKLHRNFGILFLFFVGIFLVGAADRFFEENFTGKIIFVALGAGLMTAAHLFNRRLCRACRKCGENGCAVR